MIRLATRNGHALSYPKVLLLEATILKHFSTCFWYEPQYCENNIIIFLILGLTTLTS